MPRTLVTGANGFVAVHIIKLLIEAGHDVTGTVRSADKGEQVLRVHPEWKDHLTFVTVKELTSQKEWGEAFKSAGFDHVVHTAAPLLDDPRNTDFDKHFLQPSVDGNISLLRSATQNAPNLKSIVVTGSINAITTGSAEDINARTFTSDEWLPLGPKEAREMANAYISYCVAKKEAERAVWNYVKEFHPKYSITFLLPPLIFGPPIQYISDIKRMNYSSAQFYGLWSGENEVLPGTGFAGYIDVRDLSQLHIEALSNKDVANKRIVVHGHPYSHGFSATVLRELGDSGKIPELKGRVAKDNENDNPPHPKYREDDEGVKKFVDDRKYRTKEETFGDAAKKILELEKERK